MNQYMMIDETLTINPNEELDQIPYMVISRDRGSYSLFFVDISLGKHFNPMSCGVIRNQRSWFENKS